LVAGDIGADWYGDRVDRGIRIDREAVADGAAVVIVLSEP
jgi:hypothetical protein